MIRLMGQIDRICKEKGKRPRPDLWSLLLAPYVTFITLPILLVVIGSLGRKWYGTLLPEGFTTDWYRDIFNQAMFVNAMRMSLTVAGATVALCAAISIPAVYAVYRLNRPILRSALDAVIVMPIAVPPLVIGMGLIQAYNWPWFSLVGRAELLVAAHVVYSMPFMIKPIMANLQMLDWDILNDAAESLGASGWFKIRSVLLPNLMPGILSGSLMAFAMSFGEFQLAVLLTGSATQTYPVVLYQAFYVNTGFASAATVLLVAVTLLTLWGLLVLRRFLDRAGVSAEMGTGI